MKACVVFCTIRNTKAFQSYAENFRKHNHDSDVLVVDETGDTRAHILKGLQGFDVRFYGKKERKEWFNQNGVNPQVVPPKTTDVIGFSLLVANQRNYDMIVFVDDDTYPLPNCDFLGQHWKNLSNTTMRMRCSLNDWVNPHPKMFSRGYPYALRISHKPYTIKKIHSSSVLNMGLWRNVPDLNALDYLYNGSLTAQYNYCGLLDSKSYVLGSSYMPLSRMNVAFKPKIIPAFYQFTGDEFGMGRYGDVFSGLFLMKVAKRLGDCISFGQPLCIHNKEPRDVFRDIKSECEAIKLNEKMYQVLNKIDIQGLSYADCYVCLAKELLEHRSEFHVPEYIEYLVGKMLEWVKTVQA